MKATPPWKPFLPWPSRTGDLTADTHIVYNPATGNAQTGAGRVPFQQNNVIPPSMINPVAKAILALVPAPNEPFNPAAPANNYYAALPFTKTTDSLDYKMDYNMTDKDRLSGRFSFARPVISQAPIFGPAGGGDANGAFKGTGVQKTYSQGLNYDHIFSSSLVTEVRLGVAHYHSTRESIRLRLARRPKRRNQRRQHQPVHQWAGWD